MIPNPTLNTNNISPLTSKNNESQKCKGSLGGRLIEWIKDQLNAFFTKVRQFFQSIFSKTPQNEIPVQPQSKPSIQNRKIEKLAPNQKIFTQTLQPSALTQEISVEKVIQVSVDFKITTPEECWIESFPIEEGLPVDSLSLGDKTRLFHMIDSWVQREDQNKGEWTKDELKTLFCTMRKDAIDEFCYRLQIIQEKISTTLLDYYFGAIQRCIVTKETNPPFSDKGKDMHFRGEPFLLAHGELRFSGQKTKEKWTLQDLAMYLAVDKEDLKNFLNKNEIKPEQNGTYLSENIPTALIMELESDKSIRSTQKKSIRYIGYPFATQPKLLKSISLSS